jgi:hypothetical protein
MKESYKRIGLVLITIGVVLITSFLGGIAGSYFARTSEPSNYVRGTFEGGYMGWDHYTYDRYRLEDYNLIENSRITDSQGFVQYLNDGGYAIQEIAVSEPIGIITAGEELSNPVPAKGGEIYLDTDPGYADTSVISGSKEMGCKTDELLGMQYCTVREVSLDNVGEPFVSVLEYREYQK